MDRNDGIIIRCILFLFFIFDVSVLKSILFKNDSLCFTLKKDTK